MGFVGWRYCQDHVITIASEVSNYQVKFIVYYLSGVSSGEVIYCNYHCKSDFSDLRFSVDGSTSLPYYIENYQDGVSATIWVKLPTIATTQSISVIYGNPDAVSESSGDSTFLFFDEFNGTSIDTNKWTVTGAVTVSGGICTIPSGTGTLGISGKTGYSAGKSIGFTANPVAGGNYRCLGLSEIGVPSPDNGTLFEMLVTELRARSIREGYPGQSTISGLDVGIYHTFEARWKPSTVTFYVDGVLKLTVTSTSAIPIVNLYPRFTNRSTTTVMYISSVYVRNLATNEPVHSTWSEEGDISPPVFESDYMVGEIRAFDSQYGLGQSPIPFVDIYDVIATAEFESLYKTHLTTQFEDIYSSLLSTQFTTILKGGVKNRVVFRSRIKTARKSIAPIFEEI